MHGQEHPRMETVEQLASHVFRDLHRSILTHEVQASAGDVESVHDMRVSVRRLRVALSNFSVCLAKEDRKRLRLSLENLADALGGVRDLDVMIAAMKTSSPIRLGQEKVAVSTLIGKLRSRRRSRLQALAKYLEGGEYATFKQESPSEWIHRDASTKSSSEIPKGFSKEEHGQAA